LSEYGLSSGAQERILLCRLKAAFHDRAERRLQAAAHERAERRLEAAAHERAERRLEAAARALEETCRAAPRAAIKTSLFQRRGDRLLVLQTVGRSAAAVNDFYA
jgi:hypothetical protein